MRRRSVGVIGFAVVALVSTMQMAQARDGAYRGMIVCEKMKNSPFMLKAPFDVVVTGKSVVAARPIFNLRGTRVVGSEIASGTMGDDGSIKLTSSWKAGTSGYQGSYGGIVTDKGGTLTGTQEWTLPGGAYSRACTVAIIQTES
ncbi:MAG: hypothetical protein GC182_03740 [Rhodopseudomonas sp.]|nr:hypothetical protein [Rhodopseudomonas sp.]